MEKRGKLRELPANVESRVMTPENIAEWRKMAEEQNNKIMKSVKRQLTKKDKAILAKLNEWKEKLNNA